MKLSDYLAAFLAQRGIRHVFAVTGGASAHLIQSVADTPGIDFVCPQHEQAGAMAADAYARVTGGLGAAMGTSGPGATNMLTGACCAYYDSIPVLFITGQVSTTRLKRDTGVRQIGFQETDAVDIFRPVVKYAVLVDQPGRIRYELEKACHIALTGRPGPVLIDIPDNIQREEVDPDRLAGFVPDPADQGSGVSAEDIARCIDLIRGAQRPVVVVGWGVRLARAEDDLHRLITLLGFPVVPTWAAADLFPSGHPLLIGTFGTHGTRYSNFAVQNADLILSLGARLDTKATGSPVTTFARGARKIMVDIDRSEIGKFERFGLPLDLAVQADVRDFIRALAAGLDGLKAPDVAPWFSRIEAWRQRYPICPAPYYQDTDVNPYVFVKTLSRLLDEGELIVTDTGCGLVWLMQAFEFKARQRLFHDWNYTSMGWALPAAIGASLAHARRQVICISGDGGLQMNIQELATLMRHGLPVKIFLMNNHGYSMIKQTQDQWLDSRYVASSTEGGLAFPDFVRVAKAYGLQAWSVRHNKDLGRSIRKALACNGPCLCSIEIGEHHRITPQVKFGRPNEDLEPLLPRQEFLDNMLVEPLDVSRQES